MARGAGKNGWALFLLILAGVVLGSFISSLTNGVPGLSWLNFGQSFGLAKPLTLNLGVLVLTFGLTIKFTIGSIIGIVVAAIIFVVIFSIFKIHIEVWSLILVKETVVSFYAQFTKLAL